MFGARILTMRASKTLGGGCGDASIEAVWKKGQFNDKYDPNKYRQDICRAWM